MQPTIGPSRTEEELSKMKEIANYETSIIDTGEGISFNCNGKEIALLDYETAIDFIPTPQWVIDGIRRVINAYWEKEC